MLYIMDAELIEGNYVLYQGDLSTNYVCCWEKLMHPGHVHRGLGRVWSGASLNIQKRCACSPQGRQARL
ncbi:Uncharacterized protein AC511_1460 [Pseudomonas coronafaciens pv. oryzae]|nr:Uncharacterized protein AC511_1460 [Pseudomonas coronafaciens pv. oryzae]